MNVTLSNPPSPAILKCAPAKSRMEPASFDAEYVNRLIRGDREIEDHFTAYFSELITCKLRGKVRSKQLLEDVRQETLLRVLRSLRANGIEHPERLGAYVNSFCNNVLFENYRTETRYRDFGGDGFDAIDPRTGADSLFVARERKEQVSRVMAGLPDKDRQLLQAIFLNEEDKDEVCRRFHVDRGYLRVLLHRARAKFREVFRENFGAGA